MSDPTDRLATVRAALVNYRSPGDSLDDPDTVAAIAALADECERLADLFDRIDTAFDQLRPAMADPFVAFVCATMHAAKDPAAPAPALLSDVPMGGDA